MNNLEIEQVKKNLGIEFSFLYDFLTPIIKDLELKKDATILDVGTGEGRMAPDAVDPREYAEVYSLSVEIKRGYLFDAFIFTING